MEREPEAFRGYLTRHYAHLGDHARHREGKKRQLMHTYAHLLPEDRGAEMLEIGPGYGQLLEALRQRGFARTTAVDVSREVVEFCNGVLPGSTSHVGNTVEFLRSNPGRYERVFALHVIEHIPRTEVADFVRAIRMALRPGGRMVVELPNAANFFSGEYLRYADLTHEQGYAESSLRQLLENAGFANVQCFEERIPLAGLKGVAAVSFRALARFVQRLVYRGYELPVPTVLTPALCATAVRPAETP